MALNPTVTEQIARARADMRMGVPVLLLSETPALVIPAETLSAERLNDLHALGETVSLALTGRRAATLKLAAYDGDLVRILLSSEQTISWIKAVSDPADDLNAPLKGPFKAQRGGSVDLERSALQLIKAAHLLPAAVVARLPASQNLGAFDKLTRLESKAALPLLSAPAVLSDIASASLPIFSSPKGHLHVFRPENGGEEHYAMEIGRPSRSKPVLVRLHSACFTGDVLGSLKCDCGLQLRGALQQMGDQGAGVLLYLNQEGRGIGLANKMRAYGLQDQGFDTVEANHRLGFDDDERDFRLGASILKEMGITQIKLLTNNPAKITMMERNGVQVVERVPLITKSTDENMAYLATKAAKSGHLL